ncbi:MAG: CHAT domain-containing protein, partial [Ktedonobacteraceae bacterium]
MSQLLELRILLDPPPKDAPLKALATITLNCDPLRLSHAGDLLLDPLTEQERNDLRWYLEEYWMWPYEGFAERGKKVEALLAVLGSRLYSTLFEGIQAREIVQAWWAQSSAHHQVVIESALPWALSLPWELLHDGEDFLVLRSSNPVAILRRFPQLDQAQHQASFDPPLRILLITAQPEDTGFVDPRSLARELLDEMQGQIEGGAVELEFLRPPTLAALRARLRDQGRPIQVLHFDGHGIFEGGMKHGLLAFEDDRGQLDLVRAEQLAGVLRGSRVRLVVLTACQSAVSAADNPFSSIAGRLIQCGINAVVAMSANVLVATTVRYSEIFYRSLATGIIAPVAHERARQALHNNPLRQPHRRYESEAGTPVKLFDWWLPHFYQQRPLLLQPTSAARTRRKRSRVGPTLHMNEGMPGEPRYGFFGRARELLQIERWLLQRKLVVIAGFSGTGKTALARETAVWLTRTGMYDGACFVSFERGGDASTLLSMLGDYLNVNDGRYNPNDIQAALLRLATVLKTRCTLIIADNLESVLPDGEVPLKAAERAVLLDTLTKLAEIGRGVLLTTRDTILAHSLLAPDDSTGYLTLQGLSSADAFAFATSILTNLDIDRACVPYADLRNLLTQLDNHPLAIQLVLPALRQHTIADVRTTFASLLPKFADDTEAGHNSSLLASLNYSLYRLNEKQQALLPRLAIFEGGANEEDFLHITDISKTEWANLLSALEQAGLITVERVHQEVATPFLRFHPVLAPYLRHRYGEGNAALYNSYTQRYQAVSRYFYLQNAQHPHAVRALVRRELPNLLHALTLLLEEDEVEMASEMAAYVNRFLTLFGLERERKHVHQRVEEALAAAQVFQENSEELTVEAYLREIGRAEEERDRGDLSAALDRMGALQLRIASQQAGTQLGRGSYEHFRVLAEKARCLAAAHSLDEAEHNCREALSIIDELIGQNAENHDYRVQRAGLCCTLGDILSDQGQYLLAQAHYQEALRFSSLSIIPSIQAVALGQLGHLSLIQGDYTSARAFYRKALTHFRALKEPAKVAVVWHQLGRIAEEQEEWVEAERCYRKSLFLKEKLGNSRE